MKTKEPTRAEVLEALRFLLVVVHSALTLVPVLYFVLTAALAVQARNVLGHWPDPHQDSNPWVIRGLTLTQTVDNWLVLSFFSFWPWMVASLVLLCWKWRDRWVQVSVAMGLLNLLVLLADPTGFVGWTWD